MRSQSIFCRRVRPAVLLAAVADVGLLLIGALALFSPARADALADVQLLRESGCGSRMRPMPLLDHVDQLDQVAARWATGESLDEARRRAGYDRDLLLGIHIASASVLGPLGSEGCTRLLARELRGIGSFRYQGTTWLVFSPEGTVARPALALGPAPLPYAAMRVLQLVNDARSRGATCGSRSYPPAGSVRMSSALREVAYGHALDMAQHGYFEHRDRAGRTAADRVRATGYSERLVGENLAFGPDTPDEVVRGWLGSPGHCENLMDPRFAEMGIAFTTGRTPGPRSGHGIYWVQVFADPGS